MKLYILSYRILNNCIIRIFYHRSAY